MALGRSASFNYEGQGRPFTMDDLEAETSKVKKGELYESLMK